jgi:hypothetical protein
MGSLDLCQLQISFCQMLIDTYIVTNIVLSISAWNLLCAFDSESDGLGVGGFGRLGAAYGDFIAAGRDGTDSFVVDLREGSWVKG